MRWSTATSARGQEVGARYPIVKVGRGVVHQQWAVGDKWVFEATRPLAAVRETPDGVLRQTVGLGSRPDAKPWECAEHAIVAHHLGPDPRSQSVNLHFLVRCDAMLDK